jgi:hypothetical protein
MSIKEKFEDAIKKEDEKEEDGWSHGRSVLFVSAYYWHLSKSQHGDNPHDSSYIYKQWMSSSTLINAPYIFFRGTKEADSVDGFRDGIHLPTLWVDLTFEKLRTFNLSMPDYNKIWHAKIDLMYQSYLLFPFVSWFVWADSGLNEYRRVRPPFKRWPGINLDERYPKKFIYSNPGKHDSCLPNGNTFISGTTFLVHRSVLEEIHNLYYRTLAECLEQPFFEERRCCMEDQVLYYLMLVKKPHLFHRVSGDRWCEVITANY